MLDDGVKRSIYTALCARLPMNQPLPMAKVSKLMSDLGYGCKEWGYAKMKPMMQELSEFISLEMITVDTNPDALVTLHLWAGEAAIPPPILAIHSEPERVRMLDEKAKREIYQVLSAQFPFGEPIHMARISKVLNDAGHARHVYGYDKMKSLLSDLDFISLKDTLMNGVPQSLVTLLRAETTALSTAVPVSTIAAPPLLPTMGTIAVPLIEPPPTPVAQTERLPQSLLDFARLPQKTMAILDMLVNGEDGSSIIDVQAALETAYRRCAEDGSIQFDGESASFYTELSTTKGAPIHAGFRIGRPDGGPKWVLNFVGTDYRNKNLPASQRRLPPGKALESFAYLGRWQDFLEELASMALKEQWDFDSSGRKDYYILRKYIQYTFYRLQLEDKVCISDDGQFAAFNTGLVDSRYDDIYACFKPIGPNIHNTKWKFRSFCLAGARGKNGDGKMLVDCFNPLPQPPSYSKKKEDLLFDLEKDLLPDFEHIIIQNMKRLPLGYLREGCYGDERAIELMDRAQKAQNQMDREHAIGELSEYISGTDKLFRRLRNRMQDAIDLACKQVRWNFKTALPCYFPTRNTMSLMLPLCLEDDGRADAALVVELTRSGNYQGQTVLTLGQAYLDARLLCRPNSDWLETDTITLWEDDDEE